MSKNSFHLIIHFKAKTIIDDVDIGEEMDQQNNEESEFATEDYEDIEIVVDAEETKQVYHEAKEKDVYTDVNQIFKPSINLDLGRSKPEANIRDCRSFAFGTFFSI